METKTKTAPLISTEELELLQQWSPLKFSNDREILYDKSCIILFARHYCQIMKKITTSSLLITKELELLQRWSPMKFSIIGRIPYNKIDMILFAQNYHKSMNIN